MVGHKCWLGILSDVPLLKSARERSSCGCSAASPGILVGEMTRGTAEPGASFSRAPSIAATPEVATPKSSATIEALAVIIGINNRQMWQSLPPPLVSGLGDSGGMLRTTEEEDAAAATTAASGGSGDDGGVRRRRRELDEEKQWPRASCEEDILSSVHALPYVMIKYDTYRIGRGLRTTGV